MRALPLHVGARGLEDDCALLELGSETLIITHDMMAEGTHFRADADMADVAWKLVATNLSDLAAKGAEPVGVLLGHCLSADNERFIAGLNEALRAHDVPLLGGDTVSAEGPGVFGLTAIGKATHTPVPSRSGARVGDTIYVTGTLGRAMLGFEGAAKHLGAFNRPRPLISEGQALARHVTAIMDISDGLLLDAYRMAKASNCTFDIASKLVPVAEETRRAECMRWGDDYELLFTAPEGEKIHVPATKIGRVNAHDIAPLWLDGELPSHDDRLGYQH